MTNASPADTTALARIAARHRTFYFILDLSTLNTYLDIPLSDGDSGIRPSLYPQGLLVHFRRPQGYLPTGPGTPGPPLLPAVYGRWVGISVSRPPLLGFP